jgi:hypothetical protein
MVTINQEDIIDVFDDGNSLLLEDKKDYRKLRKNSEIIINNISLVIHKILQGKNRVTLVLQQIK